MGSQYKRFPGPYRQASTGEVGNLLLGALGCVLLTSSTKSAEISEWAWYRRLRWYVAWSEVPGPMKGKLG